MQQDSEDTLRFPPLRHLPLLLWYRSTCLFLSLLPFGGNLVYRIDTGFLQLGKVRIPRFLSISRGLHQGFSQVELAF